MTDKKEKQEKSKTKPDAVLEEMAKVGLHFGHKTSRVHPKMKPYIQGTKDKIHIIDLQATQEKLEEALLFIEEFVSNGKIILFVGTKVQTKALIEDIAKECNCPYVNDRWLGGTMTNFSVILKRIEHFKDIEKKKAEGEFEKYTKKDRAKAEKELQKLKVKFEGLKNVTKIPDAIFVVDLGKDILAVREAKKTNAKVIAIADTSVNPGLADYFIPGNDDAISSVRYILEKVAEVIKEAQKKQKESDEKQSVVKK